MAYYRKYGKVRAKPLVPTARPFEVLDTFMKSPRWCFKKSNQIPHDERERILEANRQSENERQPDQPRDQVLRLRQQFPDAKVVVHPESLREVRDLADAICSTEKMITYCKNDPAKRFVIVTESGIIHRMQKECPGKEFLCAPVFDVMRMPSDNCRCSECKYMKLNTLEKVRDCMKKLAPRIELPEDILRRARLPIERMLEISARPA